MSNPFAIQAPAVINVSGGRTSALMLRRVLDAHGGTLPRDEHTVFPWSNVITTGDDPDKWRRYAGMVKKLGSARYRDSFAAEVSA